MTIRKKNKLLIINFRKIPHVHGCHRHREFIKLRGETGLLNKLKRAITTVWQCF